MKKVNIDTSEYLEECFGYPCFDCKEMIMPLTENEDDIGKNNAVRVMVKKVPNYDNTFETENEYVLKLKEYDSILEKDIGQKNADLIRNQISELQQSNQKNNISTTI